MSERRPKLLPLLPERQERQRYTKAVAIAFGIALRRARVAAGLTQKTLALKAGMDCSYTSLLERGRRQPAISKMVALSEAMGIAPEALIAETRMRLNANAKSATEGDSLPGGRHGRG